MCQVADMLFCSARRSLLFTRNVAIRKASNKNSVFGEAAHQIPITKIFILALPLSIVIAHGIVYGVYNHENTLTYLRDNVPNFDKGVSLYYNNLVYLGLMKPLPKITEEGGKEQ